TVDEWRDLIRRVCTDSLMIPMDRTRAELSVDAGEPSAAGMHTDVFAPIWHVAKMVSTLRTELAGYRTAERLMRSHSRGETRGCSSGPRALRSFRAPSVAGALGEGAHLRRGR
ncbi:hypothetical protein KI387_010874, partial [Taxus chinensis]